MQVYDIFMLLVLVATTMFGFWKGMAWQIASLASLVVSYLAALRFSTQLAPVFGEHAPWNRFVAMLAIYIATSLVIWSAFRLVSKVIDRVKLESFDRQLGAMFGLAKGVLLCVAITFFAVTLLPPTQGEAIVASQSGRYIVALLDKSHTVFPPEIHDVVDPYINRIEERLNNPGYQPEGQDLQSLWPPSQAQSPPQQSSGQSPTWMQQPAWPMQNQPQPGRASGASSQYEQPTGTSSQYQRSAQVDPFSMPPQDSPYSAPHEPNPFPGPYSAEAPASRPY
jgi:membrane protein required for colicin V production